jgi:hypothetical protein
MQEQIKKMIDLSLQIVTNNSTFDTTLYAVENKTTKELLQLNKKYYHTSEKDAYDARTALISMKKYSQDEKNIRVVKATVISTSDWLGLKEGSEE